MSEPKEYKRDLRHVKAVIRQQKSGEWVAYMEVHGACVSAIHSPDRDKCIEKMVEEAKGLAFDIECMCRYVTNTEALAANPLPADQGNSSST